MKSQLIKKEHQQQKLNICKVVEKSSSIFERLQGNFVPEASKNNEEIIQKNLEYWCQKIAKGDWQLFKKRLEWDGIELEEVRQFLGSVRLKNQQNLPDWVIFLQEVVNLSPHLSKSQIEQGLADCKGIEDKYPFEEILYPFIQVARKKLIEKAGLSYEILTSQAAACLELNLLGELSSLASNALYLEFSLFRSRQTSSLQRLVQDLNKTNGTKIYQLFVTQMLSGNLVSFLEEYAVLARLIGNTSLLWIETNAEFLRRLATDLSTIKNTFFANRAIGKIAELQPSLSDHHNGRRTVTILTFESGDKLVYKPKDFGIARAYFELLEWFNLQGIFLPFKSSLILERQGYGWIEFIKHLPCQDGAAASRFYQRAGILLCLMYFLQGVDCFYENIIANDEYPLLIDLEALMHNNFKLEREYSESYNIRPIDIFWWNSVFRVGLLPTWRMSADGKMSYDIGGLREAGTLVLPFICFAWRGVNSDAMKRESEPMVVNVDTSVPKLDDTYLNASDYTDEIVFGFREMYGFLLAKRSDLMESNSPLQSLGRQKVRYILRNTKFYTSLLRSLLEPAYLRDGVQRSIEIDIVSRMSLDTGKKAVYWPLVKLETAALEQMDIPFFTLRSDSTRIDLPNGKVLDSFCEQPSINNVITRFHDFSDRDLNTQVRLIESILRLSSISGGHSTIETPTAKLEIDTEEILSPLEFIAEAKAIAEEIKALAIYSSDGSATWIAPQLQADKYILQPLRLDLYQGVSGIILFLAALERVTRTGEYRELTRAAIAPLKKAIANLPMSTLAKNGYSIGGLAGIGSLVYAFTRVSEFLEEPVYLEDAKVAATLIDPIWIARDQHLDVLGGAAGAILALLALYRKTNDATVLDTAQIEQDIDAALQTTRKFTLQGKDHLCCGNFGRIEALLVATQAFSRQDLSLLATQQASWIVRRSQQRGGYYLFERFLPGIFHPAFFQGTSGIGYQLLRLAYPNLLPSALLLE